MKKYILSHDFGTSSDKVVLFAFDGTVINTFSKKYKTYSGTLGESEQNPNDWWDTFCEANSVILEGIDPNEVACVAIDGTDPNLICIDKDNNLLYNCIMWNDNRGKEEVAAWNKVAETKDIPKLVVNSTIAKILWMKHHHPDIINNSKVTLSTNHSYIVYRLCGNAVCDVESAIDSGMYDKANKNWNMVMLNEAGIDVNTFPKLVNPTDVVGEVSEKVAKECNLVKGIPLIGCVPDASAAGIGTGSHLKNNAVLSSGTSAGIMYTTDIEEFGFKAGVFCKSCGATYNWAMDTLLGERDFKKAEQMLLNSPPGSHGVIFIPYINGERSPIYNPSAKGSWTGITPAVTHDDLLRSVAEGIMFNINMFLEEIREKGYVVEEMSITGGFGKSDAMCQLIADIMNVTIHTLQYPDFSAAIGSAVVGGVAIGLYEDISVVKKFIKYEKSFTPIKENVKIYVSRMLLFKKLYKQLEPIFPEF